MKTLNQNNINIKNSTFLIPIFLYEIEIDASTTWRFTSNVSDYIYNGNTYKAYDIKHENISQDISGKIESFDLAITNIDNSITNLILSNDVRGNKVNIIQIFNNESEAVIEETYYIDTIKFNETTAIFSVVSAFDFFNARVPGRVINKDILPFVPESIYMR